MSLHAQPTTKDNVRRYLLAGYDANTAVVEQVLNSPEGEAAIRSGANLRSYAGYVADQIATAAGWPENPDFDPDEDENFWDDGEEQEDAW